MIDLAAPVDLAHAPVFAIGGLTVRPSTREVVPDGGAAAEVLEPRVMQVLVALHRADGAIVSRDDLTRSCWEGRVVGEDAINRVISRLRRTAEGVGGGEFRIETVTKVGYRLMQTQLRAAPPGPVPPVASSPRSEPAPSRRRLLVGAGAAGLAGLTVAGWQWSRTLVPTGPPPAPADVASLMEQAVAALRQGGPEGNAQAIGLLRRVVELRPDYPDGWGTLALCYAGATHVGNPREQAVVADRARAAASRALALDAANPYARLAGVELLPQIGHWHEVEQVCRDGLRRRPDDVALLSTLASVLGSVGRDGNAVKLLARVTQLSPPTPWLAYAQVWALWCSGRLEEADRAIEAAFQLFPLNYAVWFTRFYVLMYTGRAEQAIAMAEREQGRPLGIPEENFALILLAARAMLTRAPADVEAAMRSNLAAARQHSGQAENTIVLASALGRLDEGFTLADAYYFERPYAIGDLRYSIEQGTFTAHRDRQTRMLFQPSMASMRADPRFARLTTALGLEGYWRRTGTRPDFRRS